MRKLISLQAAIVAAVLLAACGSSGGSSKDASSSKSSTTSTTAEPATTLTTTATDKVPDVGNAADLEKAPTVSAGAPPPPTALQFKDLVIGDGAQAKASNTVRVQYVGVNYADGVEFDSSWKRGQAATFPLNGVIKGFSQGIVGMKVGGRRVVVIPPDLGYGANGQPPAVGPNETLVFVIDLVGVQ